MRILSITAQKPHSTGSGTYLTELVCSFAAAGHEQAVVCGIFPEDTVSFPDGVSCYPVYFRSSVSAAENRESLLFSPCKSKTPSVKMLPFPVVGMSDVMPYESTLYRDLTPSMINQFEDAFISAISRAISDLDPDLIICHHLFLLTALVRKHFPDRCIAGISHGTDLRQMGNCDDLRELVRPYIRELDKIFALHQAQKEQIMSVFGVSADKVSVIGSGYNDKLFNTEGRIPRVPGAPVRICYAGKLSRPKGMPELIKVLNDLSEDPSVPAFAATFAGGCQDESVQELLDENAGRFTYYGLMPHQDVAELFRNNDIFVLPSFFEGLPLVLIEAMASGMVPVCTDLPGVKQWICDNVPGQNAVFISRPEMAGVDTPTEEGRRMFIEDLSAALRETIREISLKEDFRSLPDTSGITWGSVAGRILSAK